MDLGDLARWAEEKGYPAPGVLARHLAYLRGYERVWNYRSRARGGGAANVQSAEQGGVWGLALEVDEPTLRLIDRKEGHPGRYSRGDEPLLVELVHEGRAVQGWVYQVTDDFLCDEIIPPTRAYLELIVRSAHHHGFPSDALEALKATPCVD